MTTSNATSMTLDNAADKQTLADMEVGGAAAAFYTRGINERYPYLMRARRLSELTIPTMFRREGESGYTDEVIPWNTVGAYCVNNLASKVVFALFPAGRPNFKASQSAKAAQDLAKMQPQQRQQIKSIIDAGLSQMEQDTAAAIEEDGDRAKMFVAALKLIVGGNHAFQFYDDGTLRGISLDHWVCTRDAQGKLLRWCIQDSLDWEDLPEDVEESILSHHQQKPPVDQWGRCSVDVYTFGQLLDGKWYVHQEVCGFDVAGSTAVYNEDALPYLFLPWLLLDGENYGRSYVEFYEGDLLTAESLTKSVGEGAAASARFIMMVAPTGLTNKKNVAQASNGDVISGREEDVTTIKSEKGGDFQIAKAVLDDTLARLTRAFLLNSTVQRSGDRVTAEEIRYVAQELEDSLGGVYSQQIITWQAPYVRIKLRMLQKTGRVAKVPPQAIKITVTAGVQALARNSELQALTQFGQLIGQVFGPQAVGQMLNPSEFSNRAATALGIDAEGLVPTPEEIAQQQQQAQMQQLTAQVAPDAVKALGNHITGTQVAQTNADAKVQAAQVASQPAPPSPQPQQPQTNGA